MKTFDIWAEGYAAIGDRGTAVWMGQSDGVDFADAVRRFSLTTRERHMYIDTKALTYWGCRLFDNETDARRAFG